MSTWLSTGIMNDECLVECTPYLQLIGVDFCRTCFALELIMLRAGALVTPNYILSWAEQVRSGFKLN